MTVATRSLATLMIASMFATGCGRNEVSTELDKELARGAAERTESSVKQFHVSIRRPSGPPRFDTGVLDPAGNPITVSCTTCHSTREPNTENRTSADLDEFHQGIPIAHGSISCLSCHNLNDYDSLRLSSGTRVEFGDVMTLCAQCHGTQMRDYENGAHGGMNGFWDLNRGPRTRNNCIDCHDPHSPTFPSMLPTFKPVDRFLDKPHDGAGDDHE